MKTLPLLCCVILITLCLSILAEARITLRKDGKILCCQRKQGHCLRCPSSTIHRVKSSKFKRLLQKCSLCLKAEAHKGHTKAWPPIIPLPGF